MDDVAAKVDDVAAKVFGPLYAGRRYLRTHELIAIGVASNRRTLANLVKRGDLPAPIRLGRLLLFPAQAVAARLIEAQDAAPSKDGACIVRG